MSAQLRRLGATSTAKTAVDRWLSKANMWLEEFYTERTRSPRQGLNRVFAAWKALVAALAQLASELDPGLRDFAEEASPRTVSLGPLPLLRLG